MGDFHTKKEAVNKAVADDTSCYILLMKDRKPICRTQCLNPPCKIPLYWNISNMLKDRKVDIPLGLPCCTLFRAPEDSQQEKEWVRFLGYLQKNHKVAVGNFDHYQFHILPPSEGSAFSHLIVSLKENHLLDCAKLDKQDGIHSAKYCRQRTPISSLGEDAVSNTNMLEDNVFAELRKHKAMKVKIRSGHWKVLNHNDALARNHVKIDPSFLKALSQNHSSWIFGAIAELVDNSRDAKATNLLISVGMIHYKPVGMDIQHIPMLSIMDNGCGMTHQELVRMVSFGHKQPAADNPNRIGQFGIGFKTGAMRLGKDALVLTQTSNSRSIAFLSQSLNEGKDNLEIPIVSFCRVGNFMELDISVQDEATAKGNLKVIKDFSPFYKFLIGEKSALFDEQGTGTQIYIWNLDKWGSNYSLRWETEMISGSSSRQGDIMIDPKRVRSRPGQISKKVPLDYSLKSYLEVIFLDPRMKICVQGAQIKTRPLAKSLHQTVVRNGIVMGRNVNLILGRSQLEWERANCGIFLYWHGRLIEAYKRVGSMIHSGDIGRGIIGVIDLTNLMEQKDDTDRIWVHNNKQGFQDCEAYAELERWLGVKADEYLDKYVNTVQLEKDDAFLKPDHEWVQCDKCRKWRMLRAGFDSSTLPAEWFCYMKPFNGRCEIPEEDTEDFVTISSKRSGYDRIEESENDDRYDFREDSGFTDRSAEKKRDRIEESEESENDGGSDFREDSDFTDRSVKKKKDSIEESENDGGSDFQEDSEFTDRSAKKKKKGSSSDSSQSWEDAPKSNTRRKGFRRLCKRT